MALVVLGVSFREKEFQERGRTEQDPGTRKCPVGEMAVKEDFDSHWHKLSEEVMSGMKEWRIQHPKATLSEMEDALDERLGKMRARMLEDLAMASAAVNLNASEAKCSECGSRLESRGKKARKVRTHHNQEIGLSRGYGVCPQCGASFFPPG
jgi:RNA polymerase-binding transcription factor DksA